MCAITRSPGMKPCTPSPTCLTTPAISLPGEKGSSGLNWYLFWMRRTSGKFTPLALTETRSCPLPGAGDGMSSTTSVSGGPQLLHSTAFMHALSEFAGHDKAMLLRSQMSGYHACEGVAMADNVMTSREPRYVGFWMRLLAFFIDVLLLVVVLLPVMVALYGGGYLSRLATEFSALLISSGDPNADAARILEV